MVARGRGIQAARDVFAGRRGRGQNLRADARGAETTQLTEKRSRRSCHMRWRLYRLTRRAE